MLHKKIGISDMAFYIPPQKLVMDDLVTHRSASTPSLLRHLQRALRVTGQRSMRFPESGQDSATMAAEAAHALINQLQGRSFDLASLRYLVAGTETGLDHSKPLSAYVSGMLAQAGHQLPATLSSFQVQHACAGATLAAINVAALLAGFGKSQETGLILASDIARYQTDSTAEVTQGSGAAAIMISQDPDLLELDLETMGFASSDVDDFFRPLGSVVAQVNGRYSMECYQDALETAFLDHAKRSGRTPKEILDGSDIIVLHAPFARMPIEAMTKLLATQLKLDSDAAAEFLAAKGFYQGLEPVAEIGNTYTASVFIVLAWAIRDMYQELGADIVGKRILLASYGSGNTMVVLSGTVAAGAAKVLDGWDLDTHLHNAANASWGEYLAWITPPPLNPDQSFDSPNQSGFRLKSIRGDGYRVYGYAPPVVENQSLINDLAISMA